MIGGVISSICKDDRVGYDRMGRDAERDSQGRRGVEY
jgi:hypothetical protein